MAAYGSGAGRRVRLAVHVLVAAAALLVVDSGWCGEAPPPDLAWDGRESIGAYASRVGLPAARRIDLPGGEHIELTLIPAGSFVMGTPTPTLDERPRERARLMVVSAASLLAVLLVLVLLDARRRRSWPRLTVWLAVLVVTLSTVLIAGAVRWRMAEQEILRAWRLISMPGVEKPAHQVVLQSPFYMGIHEVTQAQWSAVEAGNPSAFLGRLRPVESMSWSDAARYASQLPAPEGWGVRLPTEAEWEYACRAGTSTAFWFGDDEGLAEQFGWWPGNSGSRTSDVGGKPANPWGLRDMHGNVWEWCLDRHAAYRAAPQIDPVQRVGDKPTIRGGSWLNEIEQGRSAYRWPGGWNSASNDIGFRVVMVPVREGR